MRKNPFKQKRYFAFITAGGLVSFSGVALHSIETIIAGIIIYLICLVGPLFILHQAK